MLDNYQLLEQTPRLQCMTSVLLLLWRKMNQSHYLPRHKASLCTLSDLKSLLSCRLTDRLKEKWGARPKQPDVKVMRLGYDGFFDQVGCSTSFNPIFLFWSFQLLQPSLLRVGRSKCRCAQIYGSSPELFEDVK